MDSKSSLEVLVAALEDFEEHSAPGDKREAIAPLRRLSRKFEIQTTELVQQRQMVASAEVGRDLGTLRDLAEFSQHDEIREWAAEISNLKRQPRTLPFQTLQI